MDETHILQNKEIIPLEAGKHTNKVLTNKDLYDKETYSRIDNKDSTWICFLYL